MKVRGEYPAPARNVALLCGFFANPPIANSRRRPVPPQPFADMKQAAHFAENSVRVQISLLIVLNSTLALASAGVALFGYESLMQRRDVSSELIAQAGIIAENSTAALTFSDQRAAHQILAALRGDPRVVQGIIYDSSGKPFARYLRNSVPRQFASPPRAPGVYFEGGNVLVFRPIVLNDEGLGTIFVETTSEVHARMRRYIGIVCLILVLSQGLAWLLSASLQTTITRPLIDLAAVAERVSIDKDYALRAVRHKGGEIGILIDSFNHMLAQIESHDLARRNAETLLRESEERYAVAARGANDGLWDWKLTTDQIYFSARWSQMLGDAEPDRWSTPAEWFDRIHGADRERVLGEIAAHREGLTAEFNSEYRMRHRNGTYIWVLSRGIAVRDADGSPIRMAGSQTDVTEGKIADPLTALPNRLYLMDRMESAIETARHGGPRFAVLFLDLDRFKLVNDSLGHAAGDDLLTGVAGRLRSAIRAGWDGRSFVAARLGGDEFAVLLNEVRDSADVERMAAHIVTALLPPFHLEGRQVFVNVSLGIALSASGDAVEDILRNADTAMYNAKSNGGSRYAVFDEAMRARAVARLEIETGLRKAIEGGELVVHYQPEVSLADGRVIGYEALVRWNHPKLGLRRPDEFIPIAEETDLVVHLDRWVLREACAQMARWHRKFAFDPPVTISVNLSARHLREAGLFEDVERVLSETGLHRHCLNLEVTESSIVPDPDLAMAILRRLKSLGVGLQIDDFGTGYSSLSLLHNLPFDTVKIDRSFINAFRTGESREIVKTIIDLARSFQMETVAEGVETEEQVRQLEKLGCHYGQGYWFSKPANAAAVEAVLAERCDLRRAFEMLESSAPQPAGEVRDNLVNN